jgi:hypothetical protein
VRWFSADPIGSRRPESIAMVTRTSRSATWPAAATTDAGLVEQGGHPPGPSACALDDRRKSGRGKTLRVDPDLPTLVDDIGGWLVATMDRRAAWTGGAVSRDVDDLVAAVGAFRGPLALVSPEVGLAVVPATESGRRFADELGVVNQRLAAQCERVVLVVAGQPLTVKETS